MNEPTTTLPTEDGTYLFCGSRDGNVYHVHDLVRGEQVEVVRVYRQADGRPRYMGLDWFYEPHKTVGVWVKISDETTMLKDLADAVLLDQAARILIPPLFKRWRWCSSRDVIVQELMGSHKNDESKLSAYKTFDRAVELGILIAERPDEWKLATSG